MLIYCLTDQFSCDRFSEILTRTARVGSIGSPCYDGTADSYPGHLAAWTKIINVTHTCRKLEGRKRDIQKCIYVYSLIHGKQASDTQLRNFEWANSTMV